MCVHRVEGFANGKALLDLLWIHVVQLATCQTLSEIRDRSFIYFIFISTVSKSDVYKGHFYVILTTN